MTAEFLAEIILRPLLNFIRRKLTICYMRLGSVILDGLGKNILFIRSILNMFHLTYNNKKDMIYGCTFNIYLVLSSIDTIWKWFCIAEKSCISQ